MHDQNKLIHTLEWLNDLQVKPLSAWATVLSPGERDRAIENLRAKLPTSLLGHHDRMVARSRRSIAAVQNGACGSCHLKLPGGHYKPSKGQFHLDVCDHCGVFLYWKPADAVTGKVLSGNRQTSGALADIHI